MVSQTVQALMNAVGEELLVVNAGGSLDTASQNTFIDRLQRLIDGMGIKKPLVFTERLDTLALTANQQSYTIGIDPTGSNTANFSVPRPTRIVRANLLRSATVRRELEPIELPKWAAIRYQQVYAPPRKVYLDGDYKSATTTGASMTGFSKLFFYPIPDQSYSWELYTWQQLQQIAAASDLINYPPGYADFLLYSMVIRTASLFGRAPTDVHIELYKEAKAAIASANARSIELRSGGDAAGLNGEGGGLYNWMDGQVETA